MLVNLVSNALKFTYAGHIKIQVHKNSEEDSQIHEVDISEMPKIRLRFAVEDTGMGIREEDMGKLFKMFGTIQQHNEEINATGIGLGLTICNSILH